MHLQLMMTQPAGGGQNPLAALLPIVLIFVVFYFLIIRPQQKRTKEHRTMLESLKPGDQVVTIGGLRGSVIAVEQDTVVIRAADNVKLTFSRSAVAGLIKDRQE